MWDYKQLGIFSYFTEFFLIDWNFRTILIFRTPDEQALKLLEAQALKSQQVKKSYAKCSNLHIKKLRDSSISDFNQSTNQGATFYLFYSTT